MDATVLVLVYLFGASDGAGQESYVQETFSTHQQCEEKLQQKGRLLPFNQTLVCKPVQVKA